MKTDIVRRETPEEVELKRKKQELASLETELAERELDLGTLEAQLRAFERRYLRTVGVLYAELDDILAKIAEALARTNLNDVKAKEQASQARTRAQESAEAARPSRPKGHDTFEPPEDLKGLYREVAKRIHPDLATDPAERARRTKLMAEANRAYEEGDAARLQSILSEWEGSPEAVKGNGVGAELIRVIRKISQVKARLDEIDSRVVELRQSDLYKLRTSVREAEAQGRDLVQEMAAKVKQEIELARRRLYRMSSSELT